MFFDFTSRFVSVWGREGKGKGGGCVRGQWKGKGCVCLGKKEKGGGKGSLTSKEQCKEQAFPSCSCRVLCIELFEVGEYTVREQKSERKEGERKDIVKKGERKGGGKKEKRLSKGGEDPFLEVVGLFGSFH